MERKEMFNRFANLFREAADILDEAAADARGTNDPVENFRRFASDLRMSVDGRHVLSMLKDHFGDDDLNGHLYDDLITGEEAERQASYEDVLDSKEDKVDGRHSRPARTARVETEDEMSVN